MKIKRVRVGDIIKIELGGGYSSFARVLENPLVVFYDGRIKTDKNISLEDIISKPILFKVCVMRNAFKSENWSIVGNIDLDEELKKEPHFFKKDLISGKFTIYYKGMETPATKQDCQGLEVAGVWGFCHIEDRLRDYYDGVPNKWVEADKKLLS